MSKQYDEYIIQHTSNVKKALEWLKEHNIVPSKLIAEVDATVAAHDLSKYTPEEYDAYDDYFYGKKTAEVERAFNYAWLHHIHANPHHWQYWVLKHDDEPEEALDMPEKYVYEMICDWWSFSHKIGKLNEIFSWYEKHKDMVLSKATRKLVESILDKIKKELAKEGK